jgi:hypothetical protein
MQQPYRKNPGLENYNDAASKTKNHVDSQKNKDNR